MGQGSGAGGWPGVGDGAGDTEGMVKDGVPVAVCSGSVERLQLVNASTPMSKDIFVAVYRILLTIFMPHFV
jgi:hypothetical protein